MKEELKEQLDEKVQKASAAYTVFKQLNIQQRAAFMHEVANQIEQLDDTLLETAHQETHLPAARLQGEKARTIYQWRSYADALAAGIALPVRIETAMPDRNPAPRPSLRKCYTGLGPVVVFGASNFPFAFSVAGGDTASAIAAGCPVIVNVHFAHPQTSIIMAGAIFKAIENSGMPTGLFDIVNETGYEAGQYLVQHSLVKAVGFTGSFNGGKYLYDLAVRRPEPIPVFAEMGSTNPVFILPEILKNKGSEIAAQYAASLTLGAGQFCTNPGICILPDNEHTTHFVTSLTKTIPAVPNVPMLHQGIATAYNNGVTTVLQQNNINEVAAAPKTNDADSYAVVTAVTATDFCNNELFRHEVFGPFGMLVTYKNEAELNSIIEHLSGQLTCTVWGEESELADYSQQMGEIITKCGRFIYNGFPTGVEVCYAMQHGGPFPATTDSRFTAVGPDAIQRFARPVSFQNWPDAALPDELKDANPLKIERLVDGVKTYDTIKN